MRRQIASPLLAAGLVIALPPDAASGQSRAGENAVTQAEDAFGFSVGRESLGLYDADNARGFSPSAAGNLRIDGLYFAPVVGLPDSWSNRLRSRSASPPRAIPLPRRAASSIIACAGLASVSARRCSSTPTATAASGPSSTAPCRSREPCARHRRQRRPDPFRRRHPNRYHSEALVGRWRPAPGIELMPFWSAFTDIDDLSSPIYVPAGAFIPPEPRAGHYPGPWWNGINRTHFNYGALRSVSAFG